MLIQALVVTMALSGVAEQRDARRPSSSPAGTALIQGIVIAQDTGRPARRTVVTLTGGEPRQGRTIETDDQGAFAFADLPAGDFTLTARKAGYLDSIYGQRLPGSGRPGTAVRVTAGQQIKDLVIPIARGAAISGRVVDEVGDPAASISIRVHRWVMRAGERVLQPGPNGLTDDRGMYRIPGLAPGEYAVAIGSNTVMPEGLALRVDGDVAYIRVLDALNRLSEEAPEHRFVPVTAAGEAAERGRRGFAPVFYPGVRAAAESERITLAPGEERGGVDFALQVVPLSQLSGVLLSAGGPLASATIRITELNQPPGHAGRTVRTGKDGRFTVSGLPPGHYRISTRAAPKGSPQLEAGGREAASFLATVEAARTAQVAAAINAAAISYFAATEVAIDGRDVTDISLTLQPGASVTGRVVVAGGGQPPSLARLTIGLVPVGASDDAPAGPAALDASGRFSLRSVPPGRYRPAVLGGLPAGWALGTAIFNGIDALDDALVVPEGAASLDGVVTLTNQSTEIAGNVQDTAGQPSAAVTVIAYPADERLWTPGTRRIQAVRPATTGRYEIRGLPPGDYRIMAVPDVEPGRWHDPEYLRDARGFATITLGAGGKVAQDFRVQ